MKAQELLTELQATLHCGSIGEEITVTGGSCSDLLSHVMANAPREGVWFTIQSHPNIVAVATLVGLSAIVLTGDMLPDTETIERANKEKVVILSTPLNTFEAAGRLYNLLKKV